MQCCCGSGRSFARCCEPLLQGKAQARSAETLMRSRYCAYVMQNQDYLMRTWHPTTRPPTLHFEPSLHWVGLVVHGVDGGGSDDHEGWVEFSAMSEVAGTQHTMQERSRFVRENDSWLYLDGDVVDLPVRQPTKVSRNSLCPCGSGKKYKRCCGAD